LLVSGVFLNWLLYKVVLDCSLKDTIGALLASKALSHTISLASFKSIFKDRMPWNRTDKFKVSSRLLRALETTKVELLLGVGIFLFIVVAFILLPLPGLLVMFLIGMSYKGFDYLSAPIIAVLSELNIKRAGTN